MRIFGLYIALVRGAYPALDVCGKGWDATIYRDGRELVLCVYDTGELTYTATLALRARPFLGWRVA